MMRALPVILITVLAVSGCAPTMSRIGVSSNKPVSTVANCIGEQWNRQSPDVSVVAYASGLYVRATIGTGTLIQAEVYPTVYGSWVRLSTDYRDMIVRGHPTISAALACAG